MHPKITRKTALINGTTLYYEDVGAGEPIVFSHGLLWNTSLFDAQVAELSKEFRCISYDHRGQGRSADHACNAIDVDKLCEDAIALIESLKLGAVHFCGHSLGGFVGLRLATRRPDLVRSLTLCNTSADRESALKAMRYKLLNLVCRLWGPQVLVDVIMSIVHGASFLHDSQRAQQRAAARQQLASNRRTIWRAANGVINRPSQYNQLSSITIAALILTGAEDRSRTVAESKRMAAALPKATLVVLPRGGHMLPIEEPFRVTDVIRQFLHSI